MQFDISVNDLRFFARHGVMEEEQKLGNEFRVNLSVTIDCNDDVESDRIESTVSYVDLYEIIAKEMDRTCKLLETVAWRIVNAIRNKFPQVKSGRVSIEKVRPPIAGMIGSASVELRF